MAKNLIEIEIYFFQDENHQKITHQFTFYNNDPDLLFTPFMFKECLAIFENIAQEIKEKCIHIVPYTAETLEFRENRMNHIIGQVPTDINTKIENIIKMLRAGPY